MPYRESSYERFLQEEGIPVVTGHGVEDVNAMDLAPWPRLGGRGAYITLEGQEGLTGMYVLEIPPGGSLKPEKHLWEELLYVLSGRGATEIWQDESTPADKPSAFFEWQAGSLFAPPLNTRHRLLNGSGTEPARILAVTSAPLIIDIFHNPAFILNCPYTFADRYTGEADYFKPSERVKRADGNMSWYSNFLPDIPGVRLDPLERKGAGVRITAYEMGGNILVGHLSEWSAGRYHKGHYHGGGAILFQVHSVGYTLMWPNKAGMRPWENGREDAVVRIDWKPGSVYCPPSGWFHQHFNTGPSIARQLAFRFGSHKYGLRFHDMQAGEGVYISTRDGGALIEYEDEDPMIRQMFEAELRKHNVECEMPAIVR